MQWLWAVGDAVGESGFGLWAASPDMRQLAGILHLVGLVILIGPAWLLDLRLLGAFRQLTVHNLAAAVQPLAVTGLLLSVASGAILFAGDAPAVARDPLFVLKLLVLLLALWNAALYQRRIARAAEGAARAPIWLMATGSIFLWFVVLGLGSMLGAR